MSESVRTPSWWEPFYEDVPFELLLKRNDEQDLRDTVDFLWEKLHLSPGKTVLDQCCGVGSLSMPVAARGVNVLGVDLCERHISIAGDEAAKEAANCKFAVADAFEFVADPPCDAAFNWWTSFGYSENDAQNILMLKNALLSIKPGGWFALDYPNMANVMRDGSSRSTQSYSHGDSELTITRETNINLIKGLREQKWITTWPGGRTTTHETSLRIYLPHTLAGILEGVGFESVELLGGLHGEVLTMDSPRCICIGQRPR